MLKSNIKWAITALLLSVLAIAFTVNTGDDVITEEQRLANFYDEFNGERLTAEQVDSIPKEDRPDLAMRQNFLATMNLDLMRPTPEVLPAIMRKMKKMDKHYKALPGAAATPWEERGPDNVGGRTRALMFDPNDATGKRVFAGGVSGGLWVNDDITDANSEWEAIDDFWVNIAISCIAYDPSNTQVLYSGTGEGYGNADAVRGAGIWKSSDGGTTWNQLASTASASAFYYVYKIIVHPVTGDVYAATRTGGIRRSTDGGTSWSQVFTGRICDLEIGADNTLWAAKQNDDVYISTSGNIGSWSKIDNGFYSSPERIEIATAPSNANVCYAIVEDGNKVETMYKTTNKGATWTEVIQPDDADNGIDASDFSRLQAWYDLSLAVDPNNENTVVAGAIDLFRTTNGGNSWTQISKWSNNPGLGSLNVPLVHADQHSAIYKPGSSSEIIFGNDGGVFYSSSINGTVNSNFIAARNNGYNVTQFYAGAMSPTADADYYLAGAQDNGTQRFQSAGINSTTRATGGDGAFCFIDQTDPSIQISSYVYNVFYLSTNGGTSFFTTLQNDQSSGRFINPADYDDQLDILYSAHSDNIINRVFVNGASSTVDEFNAPINSMASHLRVSPYAPANTSTVFIGNDLGEVYKITNAQGTSPVTTEISANLPSGYISCIEIGASEDELVVTYSNYGMTSVWYTSNGGASWVSKEGDLPDMPVRWALFNPEDRNEMILATELGVWGTTNFNDGVPTWAPSNTGLANVRVDMLQMRESDKQVMAATHGRGVFTSDAFGASVPPVADFEANNTSPCLSDIVTISDMSSGSPDQWAWTITPNTFNYVGGTTASDENIQIQFTQPGVYEVALTATNANGNDQEIKTDYIFVGGLTLPFVEDFETQANRDRWSIENPDGAITWDYEDVSGNTPGSKAASVNNFNYTFGEVNFIEDYIISPAFNFSNYTSVSLYFELAYAQYGGTFTDSLAVDISDDCGNTWVRLETYSFDEVITKEDQTTSFTPTDPADWCDDFDGYAGCKTLDLSAYSKMADIKVRFVNMSGYGNNLYIDNINITGEEQAAPVAEFVADKRVICAGDTVRFTDLSVNEPTGWSWSTNPSAGVTFVGGNDIQNPVIVFDNDGFYDIVLDASNTFGSDSEAKLGYIEANPLLNATIDITADKLSICTGETVNFDAVFTNGGSSPNIEWFINGTSTGVFGTTYNSNAFQQNDTVTAILSSNENCLVSSEVTSNKIGVKVISNVQPNVSITADNTTICAGTTVNFTSAVSNGGTTPGLEWFVNGTNTFQTGPTFSSNSLNDGDQVSVRLTSSLSCASPNPVFSNIITISIAGAITPQVAITASATEVCAGQNVDFAATYSNGGSSPILEWYVGGVLQGSGPTFSYSNFADGDIVKARLTSSESCASPASVFSNEITIRLTGNITPVIVLVVETTDLCAQETVDFTSTWINGGGSPTVEWFVNGLTTGVVNKDFSTNTLVNGDQVYAQLKSTDPCANPSTVKSEIYYYEVFDNQTPTIEVNVDTLRICDGDSLMFTAVTEFGGDSAVIDWFVADTLYAHKVASKDTIWVKTIPDGLTVSAQMASNYRCRLLDTAYSNISTIEVLPVQTPEIQIATFNTTLCEGKNAIIDASVLGLENSDTLISWYVNGILISEGSTTSFDTGILQDQDSVQAILNTTYPCTSVNNVASNYIHFVVDDFLDADVAIYNDKVEYCEGDSALFKADVTGNVEVDISWFVNDVLLDDTNKDSIWVKGILHQDSVEVIFTYTDCEGDLITKSSNKVGLFVNPSPNVSLVLQRDEACEGDNLIEIFGGSPVFGVYTGDNVEDGYFNPTTEGDFEITYTVVNDFNCAASVVDIFTVNPTPNPNITRSNDTLFANTPGTSYQWKRDGVIVKSGDEDFVLLSKTGNYTVRVINEFGCSATSEAQYFVTGINDIVRQGLNLYPVPASDVLFVKSDYTLKGIVVLDVSGRQLQVSFEKVSKSEWKINTSNLSPGTYQVILNLNDIQITESFVIYR